jgi:cell wall-associated NlpC family hydrolase
MQEESMRRLFSPLIILPALIGMVAASGLAYAHSELSDVQHKLQQVQQEKKASQLKMADSKNKLDEIQKEVQSSKDKLNDLNGDIHDVAKQLQSLQTSIQKEKAELTQTVQDLADANVRVQKRDQRLAQKLQSIYENGNVSYLDVLLGSKDFSDFLSRWQYLGSIVSFDRDMLESDKQDKLLIAQQEALLQQELEEVQQNYDAMQRQHNKLLAQKADESVTMASYSQKQQDLEDATQSEMQDLQELAEREAALLEQEKELKALAESSSALATHASLQKVIHPLLGIKYVWGGTTTKGFDCSGFTQYVLAEYGVHLPRTSAEQSKYGEYVSKDDLRAGDLVFFHTYGPSGTVTHVALYIGNGEIVNAVSTSVQINKLNDHYFGSRYITSRRVLSDKQYEAIEQ